MVHKQHIYILFPTDYYSTQKNVKLVHFYLSKTLASKQPLKKNFKKKKPLKITKIALKTCIQSENVNQSKKLPRM